MLCRLTSRITDVFRWSESARRAHTKLQALCESLRLNEDHLKMWSSGSRPLDPSRERGVAVDALLVDVTTFESPTQFLHGCKNWGKNSNFSNIIYNLERKLEFEITNLYK